MDIELSSQKLTYNLSFIDKYDLIINCDYFHNITKKYFSKKIIKEYNSFTYTTIIKHEKILNETAIQIFTKRGPLAFLPISNTETSIVYSIHNSVDKRKDKIEKLIKEYNFKYKISKIDKSDIFELKSSHLRSYYNNNIVSNDSIEYKYFDNFIKDFPELNKRPYRTEWTVFNEDLRLAGSIDMIFENPDDNGETLLIYDWKRSKEIVKTNGFDKFGILPCIEHLPDSNYWHYCLQLNTYKKILETKYDKKVSGMYLICLHPENKNKNYIRIKVADLSEEICDLFKDRKVNM